MHAEHRQTRLIWSARKGKPTTKQAPVGSQSMIWDVLAHLGQLRASKFFNPGRSIVASKVRFRSKITNSYNSYKCSSLVP